MALVIEPETPPLATDAHGVVRVGGTRLTLDTVVYAFQAGSSAEEIADDYGPISLSVIYAAIAYYLEHGAAVEPYVQERGALAAEVKREHLRRYPQAGLRERLLARLQRAEPIT
jgi:uncharacterized protein (DUF433 family)